MLIVWQVAKCEPTSAGVRVRGGNASPGCSILRPTGNVAGRTYVSSISVIAFTSMLFSLSPSPYLSTLRLPVKRGKVPVRTTDVPGQIMVTVTMRRGLRECQPGRDRMPGIGRPHRLTAIPSCHGCDGYLQNVWNRYVPRIAFHGEGDRGRLYPKKVAPQHRHTAHRTAHFPREDLAQRLLLCRGRLRINIQGRSPIAVPHLTRPRKGDHENRRAVVKGGLAIPTVYNMESEHGIAAPTRGWGLDETRTDQIAITGFEVFTAKVPWFLRHTVISLF